MQYMLEKQKLLDPLSFTSIQKKINVDTIDLCDEQLSVNSMSANRTTSTPALTSGAMILSVVQETVNSVEYSCSFLFYLH